MRTDGELLVLEEILIRMKFVSELSLEKRLDLCRIMGHLKVAADTRIFRQGDPGTDFYVILHGSVNVLIKDPVTGVDNVVATLYGGDSFGELALLQEGNRRAASIVARDDCEFLTIGREDYNGILRDVSESYFAEQVSFLKELTLFKGVASATVQSVAYVLSMRDYPRNTVVLRQGSECEDIYFVVSGGVKLVREVEDRALLRQNKVLADGPGSLLTRRLGKGGVHATPPAPLGFGDEDNELLGGSDFGHLRPGSRSPLGEEWRGGGEDGRASPSTLYGEYADYADTSFGSVSPLLAVNLGDDIPIGKYGVGDEKDAAAGNGNPAAAASRRSSAIDTGQGSPSKRSEAAAKAGLGRLFLEVGALKKYGFFGDTVLTRKAKQSTTAVTTASTRCYVLSKWDLLRRVDKSVIEHVRRVHAEQTASTSNDRSLIREFQRSQEWAAYKKGLVEEIIDVKRGLRQLL